MTRLDPPALTVALAGTPNVGKSTLFNALTGLRQHTGNWIGKTVETARGVCRRGETPITLVDLPGTYSLAAQSQEERCAREYLLFGGADAVIVVCDAGRLARSLRLALEIMQITPHVVLCLHLLREAQRNGVTVFADVLERQLGVPVVCADARRKTGLDTLLQKTVQAARQPGTPPPSADARQIAQAATQRIPTSGGKRCADDILLHRRWGAVLMALLLAAVLLLTVYGANVPSRWLGALFFSLQAVLERALTLLHCPPTLTQMLVFGVYRTLAWVMSVMLPPMAIFFPLFTLLEDCGYLPRAAFRLDCPLHRCHACGKQALTMCMGLGCNAAAVTGCRIMDSARERKLAILTNAFVPCNGRFPMLIAVLTAFFAVGRFGSIRAAAMLCGCVALGVLASFAATRLLSATVLRGDTSAFVLELPPFRWPQVGQVIVRSMMDRTLKTAARAAVAAAPAGLLIWLAANVHLSGGTLLQYGTAALEPIGRCLGVDGVILTGFLLAFPANEIVLPAVLLGYTAQSTMTDVTSVDALRDILTANGWTRETAVCFLLLALFHAPCATTIRTIYKETGSVRQTVVAVLLPVVCGVTLCACVHGVSLLLFANTA